MLQYSIALNKGVSAAELAALTDISGNDLLMATLRLTALQAAKLH